MDEGLVDPLGKLLRSAIRQGDLPQKYVFASFSFVSTAF